MYFFFFFHFLSWFPTHHGSRWILTVAVSRHRRITPLFGRAPQIASNAFIAPNASVIGQVELGENSSVWYGALLRGALAITRSLLGATITSSVTFVYF
jgi:serine acetyltransferase